MSSEKRKSSGIDREMQESLPAKVESTTSGVERFHSDQGLGGMMVVVGIWALLTIASVYLMAVSLQYGYRDLMNFLLLAATIQIPFLIRIWFIDASPEGLRLGIILGRRRLPWRAIDDVVYSPLTNNVTELVVNGKRIALPQSHELTAKIRANTKDQHTCHSDHRANRIHLITERSIPSTYGKHVLQVLVCVYLVASVFSIGLVQILVICIGLLWMPIWALLNILGNHNRAMHVRTSEHGITFKTALGSYHVPWNSVQSFEEEPEGAYFVIKTESKSLKLGSELSNYPGLVRRICDEMPFPQNRAQVGIQNDQSSVTSPSRIAAKKETHT